VKADVARRDLAAALAAAPPCMRLETQLLRALQAGGACEAVLGVPPNLRHLYAYAYQSLLWNRLVSERLRLLGDAPVEGDLVLAAAAPALLDGDDAEAEPLMVAAGDEVDNDQELGGEAAVAAAAEEAGAPAGAAPPPSSLRPHSLPAVRALTAADVAGGAFSLEHVLMPLPGFAVRFPQHCVGAAAAARLLADDGFGEASPAGGGGTGAGGGAAATAGGDSAEERVAAAFSSRDRRFQFAGGYRALVSTARDAQWRVLRGVALHEDVLTTDAEAMRGGGRAARAAAAAAAGGQGGGGGAPALLVSFSLAKSAYATVALREAMEG